MHPHDRFAGASIAVKIGPITPGVQAFVGALEKAIEAVTAQMEASGGASASAATAAKTAAELSNAMSEEEVAECPATLMTGAHDHELTRSFGRVYGHGTFGCNVCRQMGEHGNYQCATCGWDAHPHCVVPALAELVCTAPAWPPSGAPCRTGLARFV